MNKLGCCGHLLYCFSNALDGFSFRAPETVDPVMRAIRRIPQSSDPGVVSSPPILRFLQTSLRWATAADTFLKCWPPLTKGSLTEGMAIGTQLRPKVISLYLMGLPNRFQKCRASFSELSNCPYVGHSPDQVIKTEGTDTRTLIKVKIYFKGQKLTKERANKLAKKHNDQMQLGMRVHNCKECMLSVYSCPKIWRSAPCQISKWTKKICLWCRFCRMRIGGTNS